LNDRNSALGVAIYRQKASDEAEGFQIEPRGEGNLHTGIVLSGAIDSGELFFPFLMWYFT
jgi:hypothetical protein